ncbi:MAG TPA: TOBE domain-containing protein, partial [Sinorhizobium sp.]|nr:TOBE domain-containing protein [Sinorhizobium sp.]
AMNMINGRLDASNPNAFITADGTALPVARPAAAARGRDLVYGLRPEYMTLDPNGLPAEVVVIEPTGYETQMIVRLGGADVTGVFRERVNARPGDTIHLAIDGQHVHLFDAETGRRLFD